MLVLGPVTEGEVGLASFELARQLNDRLIGRHHPGSADSFFPGHPDACSLFVEEVIPPGDSQDLPLIEAWRFRSTCHKHGSDVEDSLVSLSGADVQALFREAYMIINTALAQGTFIFAADLGAHPLAPSDRKTAKNLSDRSAKTLTLIPGDHAYPNLMEMSARGGSEEAMRLAERLFKSGYEVSRRVRPQAGRSNAEALALGYQMRALVLASYGCETSCVPRDHKRSKEFNGLTQLAVSLSRDCENLNDNFPFDGSIASQWAMLAAGFASFHIGQLVRYVGFGSPPAGADRELTARWRKYSEARVGVLHGLSAVEARLAPLEDSLQDWLSSKKMTNQRWAAQLVLIAEAIHQARLAFACVPGFKSVTF